MLVPTGRNRDVLDLAHAVGEIGRVYVDEVTAPILADIKDQMTHQTWGSGGGHYVGWTGGDSQDDYDELASAVKATPAMLSSQIGLAQTLRAADTTLNVPDLEVHSTITRMANKYPWLTPKLVHLRHALSQQAIEDNVATPAARQIGLG